MPLDDERYVTRRDFERENDAIREEIKREKVHRAAEWDRFKSDLKIAAGIDLADDDRMERFRGAIRYAADRVKALADAALKSPLQRVYVVLIAIGGALGAVTVLWPVLKNALDLVLGAKH